AEIRIRSSICSKGRVPSRRVFLKNHRRRLPIPPALLPVNNESSIAGGRVTIEISNTRQVGTVHSGPFIDKGSGPGGSRVIENRRAVATARCRVSFVCDGRIPCVGGIVKIGSTAHEIG